MHINIKSNYVHVSIISYKSNMMRVSNTNVSEQSHVIPDYTNYANLTVIKTRITFTLIHVYYLQWSRYTDPDRIRVHMVFNLVH